MNRSDRNNKISIEVSINSKCRNKKFGIENDNRLGIAHLKMYKKY